MYEYLIYDQLVKFEKAEKAYHMPGHKARGDFAKKFPVANIDVTELPYSDNLMCPTGVIAKAQEEIAAILGAQKSYILTDGSSSGIMAMLYAASKRGNKIIVPRNSHLSVWNACAVLGLEPVIIQGKTERGVICPPDPDDIEQLVVNDVNIAGMIAVSPDYYGNISPLSTYSDIMKRNKRILLVDGAHGAHLAFSPDKAGYAGVYADAWVDGAHKTLPTLTQGAVLNLGEISLVSDIEDGLNIFRTTSPSYPVMASVEYGVKSVSNNSGELKKACEAAKALRDDPRINCYPSDDWAKIAVDCEPYGISADLAAEALEKKDVYCELSDGRYLLFYLSAVTTVSDIKRLKTQLLSVLFSKKLKGTYRPKPPVAAASRTYSFQYALKRAFEWINLESAAGRMCARNAGITPPCIPVVAAGEIITEAAIRSLKSSKTFGIVNGKIAVVKK